MSFYLAVVKYSDVSSRFWKFNQKNMKNKIPQLEMSIFGEFSQ